ncbi:hypothetical protein G7Y89_g9200 [Cudoniella acicularis]|uniref:Rhodopsin domain-containing protein n=1 Tax=Cudoniella acicularis TaxID=354080 RepID=A0A8H4VZV5_9HELO|nr:hypothetical protein G7Y89_g9200 [Cudoniella acicularis]
MEATMAAMAHNYTFLSNTPAAPPPLDVIPNFVDPYSKGYLSIMTVSICIVVSSIAVWAKLYTKFVVSKTHGWEDYTILLGWALFMCMVATAVPMKYEGIGIHEWNLSLWRVIRIGFWMNVAEVLYATSVCIVKISIVLQILKIFFPGRRTPLFFLLWGIMIFNILLYISIVIMEIFQCTPREKIWNPLVEGACVNVEASFIFTASANLISDLVLLLVPVYLLLQLNMSLKRKIGVGAIFASGIFACVSSLMRLIYSIQLLSTVDYTWVMLPLGLWCIAEVTSGILASCLPSIPRLFQHIRGKPNTAGNAPYTPNGRNTFSGRRPKRSKDPNTFASIDRMDESRSGKVSSDWIPLK